MIYVKNKKLNQNRIPGLKSILVHKRKIITDLLV